MSFSECAEQSASLVNLVNLLLVDFAVQWKYAGCYHKYQLDFSILLF